MAKKTSANAKARYTSYANSNTAAKNKAARAERHAKRHPNDAGGTPLRGNTQGMGTRSTKLEAALKRAVQHELLFGQETKQVKGRDLSNAKARKAFLESTKAKSNKKAA